LLEPGSDMIVALRPLLDASEQLRADRFRMAEDRESYIAAHALIRVMLSNVAGNTPTDWRFRTTDSGKPMLDPTQAPRDLHFSLSHTRGLVACAVGWPYPMGIDAEAWRAPAPIELAMRFFAPAEAHLVAAGRTPIEQCSTFYRLWTLKEAYLKATGQGLATELDSFAVSLDPVSITIAGTASCVAWHFAEFLPSPEHSVALAVQSPTPIPLDAVGLSAFDCLPSESDLAARVRYRQIR
jgi:4'-phosphopantetheinyl transferase